MTQKVVSVQVRRLRQPLPAHRQHLLRMAAQYISGNRCDKPVTGKSADNSLNLYAYKQAAAGRATSR